MFSINGRQLFCGERTVSFCQRMCQHLYHDKRSSHKPTYKKNLSVFDQNKLTHQKSKFKSPSRKRNIKPFVPDLIRKSHLVLTSMNPKDDNFEARKALDGIDISCINLQCAIAASSRKDSELNIYNDESIIEIENRSYSIEEWNNVLEIYGQAFTKYSYSRNIKLQSIMMFILGSNVADKHDLRSDPLWNESDLVQSFIDFLLNCPESFEVSQPSLHYYVKHCTKMGNAEAVISLYKKLKEQTRVYSPYLSSALVAGMRDTDACYNEVLELTGHHLDGCSAYLDQRETNSLLNALGICALRNNDYVTALECLTYLTKFDGGSKVNDSFLEAFFTTFSYSTEAEVWERNRQVVEAYFNLLHQCNLILPNEAVAHKVAHWFFSIQSESWSHTYFAVTNLRKPVCPVTGQALQTADLTPAEFDVLKGIILQVVMKKMFQNFHIGVMQENKDRLPYSNSIVEFLQYLLDNGPFDMVIDGLNIIYSATVKKDYNGDDKFNRGFNEIEQVLTELNRRSGKRLKILIPLRRHMKSFIVKHSQRLFELANVVFVDNNIADDSVHFYACICSGPQCYLVSRDLFRDYRFFIAQHLGRAAGELFVKYQRSRQLDLAIQRNGKMILNKPNVVHCCIQKSKTTWHFPFLSASDENNFASRWLCVHQKPVVRSSPPHESDLDQLISVLS